ncbi:MAG TPA: HD domain-containing protein [Vicinamibacterales bacterium]|jgi:[protein-PII] uridylyltransferase|nr:HD domain-containing protein [Vicinamibacterales bacterium]
MSITQSAKASLDAARDELRASIARGDGGRGALEHYADRVDALIRQLFTDAGPYDGPVSIIALGGYGRRHLCLHSDIDLLLLFGSGIGPAEERFVNSFLNPLWDLGVVVGHQVRDIGDLQELETDNPEFLLALLDARPVAGARSVFERFTTLFHQAGTHAFILRSLLALIDERHANFNATLYQLEPDVKEAPGALRDLTATRTIALLTDPLLLRRGPADAARFDDAEDFLLRVRSTLHLECGRNQNILSHELQERTAEILGYPGSEPRQRVERLMSDYFRHARIVSRSLEWARRTAPVPVGPNLGLTRDGVRFIDPMQAARNPSSWLGAFQAALDAETEVSEEALSCIQQHVDRYRADDFFADADDRAALLRFLKPQPGLYARLSQMHDCGLLGRVFPEFQAISWRVVRDFYHKYTVDEHTLLTIRNLERLITTEDTDRMRFRSILLDLLEPELLVAALLFHDVGKWRDDDHAIESVRMADHVLERLQVTGERRETVLFLIRHHLRMSLAAFRRDTEDPDIVKQFASLVGTEERLKLLCLMTLVDIEAVSPGTLTPWKAELLWRLYVDTYNHLTQRYGDELIERNQAGLTELQANRPHDMQAGEITRFLEGLPQRYLHVFPRDTIYRHIRLARDIKPDEVHLSLEQNASVWSLAVATLDKPFLFSNICGVLSSFGMDILRGHAFTNPNGLVLDAFEFTDDERFLALNRDGQEQMMRVMQDVVSGRADVTKRLRGREKGVLQPRSTQRFSPVVHADNKASGRYTILDIVTGNALGLLYRISRVISQHGCDVDLVLIATEGEKAIDVFHITKAGAKLTEAEQTALTSDLQRTLEGTV